MISKLFRALLVMALTAAVAAAPVAARIPPPDPPGLSAYSEPLAPTAGDSHSASGFNVTDAAIGAGSVIALLVLAGSGMVVVRRTRAAHGA
jgi:hypothetical protein